MILLLLSNSRHNLCINIYKIIVEDLMKRTYKSNCKEEADYNKSSVWQKINNLKRINSRYLLIALLAISFTGCYTSFVPRDYEEESFGSFDQNYNDNYDENYNDIYYDSNEVVADIDSMDYYDEEYLYEDPQQITIINNYPNEWGWDYYPRVYVNNGFSHCGFYDPFYDAFCGPYYYPYYRPYYSGVYLYGDVYYDSYYGGSSYYPSEVRYRRNRSHWTSLRNNGGRNTSSRERDINRGTLSKTDSRNSDTREARGFDLDKDLRVTRSSGTSSSSATRNSGLKIASLRKNSDDEARTTVRKKTDLERRRVTDVTKDKLSKKETLNSSRRENQRVTKKTRVNRTKRAPNTQNRSKRVYSSSGTSKSKSSTGSSRSYYKPPSRSSSKTYSKPKSSRKSGSNSRSYSSSGSSSKSNVSNSSGSSSRSSVSSSRSSGSSSRSSSSRSSSSSSSSRGSSKGRR